MATVGIETRRSWNLGVLVASLAACFFVAGVGVYWTNMGLGAWYNGLNKPTWTPPNRVFGPVWTTLYILMATAAWLVWRARGWSGGKVPLTLYGVQLALNLAWPGIFFALKLTGAGFLVIALLWLTILATIIAFARVRPWAAVMLVPYLAWVSYASALNFIIWRLNG